jgi:hypothetical protein
MDGDRCAETNAADGLITLPDRDDDEGASIDAPSLLGHFELGAPLGAGWWWRRATRCSIARSR